MNTKILKIDLISYVINLCLLILLMLSNTFFNSPEVFAIIFGVITLGTMYLSTYLCYKSDIEKVKAGNIIVLIGCIIANFVVYCLPFLGLFGRTGINGIMNFSFLFMYFGRVWIYVSFIVKSRSRNVVYSIGNNTLNSSKNYYKVISIYGWGLIALSSFFLIVGMFIPFPDPFESVINNTISMLK